MVYEKYNDVLLFILYVRQFQWAIVFVSSRLFSGAFSSFKIRIFEDFQVLIGRQISESPQAVIVLVLVLVIIIFVIIPIDDGVRDVRIEVRRSRGQRSGRRIYGGRLLFDEAVAADVSVSAVSAKASVGRNGEVLDGVLEDGKSLSTTRLVEAESHDRQDEDDEQGGESVHHPLGHVVFVHERL